MTPTVESAVDTAWISQGGWHHGAVMDKYIIISVQVFLPDFSETLIDRKPFGKKNKTITCSWSLFLIVTSGYFITARTQWKPSVWLTDIQQPFILTFCQHSTDSVRIFLGLLTEPPTPTHTHTPDEPAPGAELQQTGSHFTHTQCEVLVLDLNSPLSFSKSNKNQFETWKVSKTTCHGRRPASVTSGVGTLVPLSVMWTRTKGHQTGASPSERTASGCLRPRWPKKPPPPLPRTPTPDSCGDFSEKKAPHYCLKNKKKNTHY